ncbi:hypothetical protein HP570_20355 [Brevibacillus sp. RS1.1]|uniref:hypothetical protein n=1 Tax=Brevibacillus sp. RS1.1 TaxID=2738982 RepID=UPI00156B0367|nr:hypothetical protein [Brevibacillus sp. RS1.1]NRR04570.1 hypothetical protein [Brevibacillus sp. RS1.1]
MIRLEGYISKKIVKRWLEDYAALVVSDRPIDAIPSNSSPKAYDGVSGGQINKIMVDQALEQLRQQKPLTYRCAQARWILQLRTDEALQRLKVTKTEYIKSCTAAVDYIYKSINGKALGVKMLVELIIK